MIRLVLVLLASVSVLAPAQRPSRLSAGTGGFLLDGQPFQIISGELHYPRVPRAYWRDRLRKARAMGLNTVSTYVFWNLHEPAPGRFDFTGQNDVAAFIRTAAEEGLHASRLAVRRDHGSHGSHGSAHSRGASACVCCWLVGRASPADWSPVSLS